MKLALKIDVDTYRGTREGIPNLLRQLGSVGADATFLFSLGPDHTGRAIKRVFRRGFLAKVQRTSVLEHYGLRTLLYGTLLPGPDIGKQCADALRAVAQAGFETGIHTWDHIAWQDGVLRASIDRTQQMMQRAFDRYADIFGQAATVHGAAGWQMNAAAYAFESTLGFRYASDTRGVCPFIPVVDGNACVPQLPTTLPTLDELIGVDGATPEDAARQLLALTEQAPATGHVYTLHAELEGARLAGVFDTLLKGWQTQGYQLVSMQRLFDSIDSATLPRHRVIHAALEGRSGTLAQQGPRQ